MVHHMGKDKAGLARVGYSGVVKGTKNKAAAEFYINELISEGMGSEAGWRFRTLGCEKGPRGRARSRSRSPKYVVHRSDQRSVIRHEYWLRCGWMSDDASG